MKTYSSDLEKLDLYVNSKGWEKLAKSQVDQLAAWGQAAASWRNRHDILDRILMILPIVTIAIALWWLLFCWPHLEINIWVRVLVFTVLHGWLLYSLSIYSLHECAGHRKIGRSKIQNLLIRICSNLCRFTGADPVFYLQNHSSHHQYLGTAQDATFTNWVQRGRLLRSLIPGSPILVPSDFFVHIGNEWTRSKAFTVVSSVIFASIEFTILFPSFGWIITATILLVISPWLGACFDRLRDTSEHVLRPADTRIGARDFGLGFYGWIFCGGPWGQPFHLTHHLLPTLPWYQQIQFGMKIRRLLTCKQIDHKTPIQLLRTVWRMSAL